MPGPIGEAKTVTPVANAESLKEMQPDPTTGKSFNAGKATDSVLVATHLW
jgi:hypothetical protein